MQQALLSSPPQSPTALDTGARAVHDSLVVDSIRMDTPPLPMGVVARTFRFLFSGVPQWVQIGGVILGAIVAIVIVTLAIRHRAAILEWLAARSRTYKIALGAGVGGTMLAVGLTGGWTYNYMMHENDFCSSCHVMKTAFGKFQNSEHSKLACHACHQQSIFASTKELYYWVMERPEKIPAHSKVPNKICADCHITQKRDSVWQRVIATAGHQVHLKSDSASLRDVMCVTCHARQVHAFKSNDLSCGQTGCHENQKIKLGKMANQSSLHCITCHEFTKTVSESITVDSTKRDLVPIKKECFSCHEMREKLASHGLDKDPHKGTCGTCHNPHEQENKKAAIKSCATSECHASADTLTAFHRGLGKHGIDNCVACHKPHEWKVQSTSCLGCHKNIFDDTRSAPRKSTSLGTRAPLKYVPHVVERPLVSGRGGPSAGEAFSLGEDPAEARPMSAGQGLRSRDDMQQPRDTLKFSHARHRKLQCEKCHDSSDRHGALLVTNRASCQACHHAKDGRSGTCETCHARKDLPSKHVDVSVHVVRRPADATRTLTFEHQVHAKESCSTCHDDSPERRVIKTCTECHAQHHTVERTCSSCHPSTKSAHDRLAHDGCTSCHADAAVASLPPVRTLCLSCHQEQRDHKTGRECVSCHRVSWNEVKRDEAKP